MSFFGTGNIASVSSFDPNWVRCFVSTFSPFLMASLIILKLLIPVLVVMCAVRQIHSITKVIFALLFNFINLFIKKSLFYFQTNYLDSARQIFHHNSFVLWHNVPEFLIFGEKYRIMARDRHINITFCYYGVDRCRIMSNTNCSKVPNNVSVADIIAIRKNTWPERWYS